MYGLWMVEVHVMKTPKVFCVGMHKTGTTSMSRVFLELGYTPPTMIFGINGSDIENSIRHMADKAILKYDAFEDDPWPLLYEYLDIKCPGSKFILTVRDTESWYYSVLSFFGAQSTPMRQYIYGEGAGSPVGNKDVYTKRFEKHRKDIEEYFTGRPDSLMTLDLSEGDQWKKICGFLNMPIPGVPFPHANKSQTQNNCIFRR